MIVEENVKEAIDLEKMRFINEYINHLLCKKEIERNLEFTKLEYKDKGFDIEEVIAQIEGDLLKR